VKGEALDETFSVWWCSLGEDILKGVLFFSFFFLFIFRPWIEGDLHDVKGRRGDLADTRMLAGGDILPLSYRYTGTVPEVRLQIGSSW